MKARLEALACLLVLFGYLAAISVVGVTVGTALRHLIAACS